MEKTTKALLVFIVFLMAFLIGAEGGRDVPKKDDQLYNSQHFFGGLSFGYGWPFPCIPGFGGIPGLGPFGPIRGIPSFGLGIGPGVGPGAGSGYGPGVGPGGGPDGGPGVGPGVDPGVGPGYGPGVGRGVGPGIGPGVGPGVGPGGGPGYGIGGPNAHTNFKKMVEGKDVRGDFFNTNIGVAGKSP